MNKEFDFSQPGKFPVTQENLDWLQEGAKSVAKWMSYYGGSNMNNIILSGCECDKVTGIWSDGWVSISGEVLPFVGGTIANSIVVLETAANVVFDGGVAKPVKLTRYATCQTGFIGTNIAQIPRLSDYLGAGAVVNAQLLSGSTVIAASSGAGNAAGTIYYRLNKLTRTVHIDGELTFGSAQTIIDPALMQNLFTIPAAYVPKKTQLFEAYYRYHGTTALFKDFAGDTIIRSLLCEVRPTGDFNMGIIKPDAAIASYLVKFNTIYSLD